VGKDAAGERLTLMQRSARSRVRKAARRGKGEPLAPEDWAVFFEFASGPTAQRFSRVLRALPRGPRCGICGAPFAGFGARLVRPLGYRQSRKSPNLCDTCVEASPPGGMTMRTGVLFADIRGFTSISERSDPEAVSILLRRFYAAAEHVLFPEAVIDKLIGDEVMALYLPYGGLLETAPSVMLDHARRLLAAVGYGSGEEPFAEVGVGLDFGEAFVGNVGGDSYSDFTAIGDVVNVAARLQGEAAGGEIVASARLVAGLDAAPGEPIELELKGKAEPVAAYRIAV
jgi:adenylate cyclase